MQKPEPVTEEVIREDLSVNSDDGGEPAVARGISKTPLINREHVRALLLDLAKARAHKYTRVSEETLLTVNEIVRAHCVYHVGRFPSKGKTL
ncbi:MAG TPA: hypothetical protein VG146_01725 [Verrucomicrobiae bacterium]|nr:hypothetical protein [Verrucomicrobiae bacterium]